MGLHRRFVSNEERKRLISSSHALSLKSVGGEAPVVETGVEILSRRCDDITESPPAPEGTI